jgi:hypothetical protein
MILAIWPTLGCCHPRSELGSVRFVLSFNQCNLKRGADLEDLQDLLRCLPIYIPIASHYSRRIAQWHAWHEQADQATPAGAGVKKLLRGLSRHLGFKMINDPVNNLQIKLFEAPDSLVNFVLPKKFDEDLSLPWSGRLIRKKLQK